MASPNHMNDEKYILIIQLNTITIYSNTNKYNNNI